MSKSKKILKVLSEMFIDGITHLLVFVLLIIATITLFLLMFAPAIIVILVFGKELGGNITLIGYGGVILIALTYDFVDRFKRRMSRYE